MDINNTIKENIIKVCNDIFKSNMSNMARKLGINRNQMQTYVTNTTPSADVLRKFVDIGISSDFLLTGKGSMFADNKKGQQLKLKYDIEFEKGKYRIVSEERLQMIYDLMEDVK